MRIRTILAAATAPLALGAILLGTAGQASAATVTPVPQHAYVQVQNDPDSNVTGTNWANDNISRFFTVRETAVHGVYDVQTSDYGIWNAIPGAAAPLDETGQTHMGSEHGWFTGGADFTVSSPNGGASQANLLRALGGHFTVSNGTGTSALVQDLFPAGATVTSAFNTWNWAYHYGNEVMVQQSAAPNYTDTPTKIFTNGG